MRTSTLASLLLILALAGLAIQQGPPCMTGQIPDVKLLKGDIHAIDLDTLVSDSQPDLKVEVNVEEADNIASLITTFKDYSPNEYVLEEEKFGQINRCTAYSQGLSDGDWAFLCDKNKIVFVTVNETLGLFDPQRTTVINLAPEEKDKDLTCDSIRNGGTQNLYAVCQKPGSDSIFIFTLDLLAPLRQEPDEIKQPKAEYMLVAPYKLSVNEYITDAGPQISVFIHEREPKTDQLHFRMFKNVRGRLVDGGYFSSKIPGTIKNAKDGKLQSVFVNDEFVYLNTRVGNDNFLQRCLRNPIYSTFVCDAFTTKLASGDYRIKFFYVDKTKRTTKMVWVYYVSADRIKYELYDPDTNTYIPDVEDIEFKGHSLKKIVDYQRAGNNFFLVGPTDSGKLDIADGVVKIKTRSNNTWEEYSYGPDASLGLVMQDLHETHYANYLSVGSNKISFMRIKKNILMINTGTVTEEHKSMTVTVTCKGDIKKSQGKLSFQVNTQQSVNDENSIRVSVPSVEAYVGSSYIYLATNGDEISGNAPIVKSITTDPLKNITFQTRLIDATEFSLDGTEITDISGLKHIGESYFALESQDTLRFFRCLKGKSEAFACEKIAISVDLKTDNLVHIHSEVEEGVAVILLSQRVPEDAKKATATPKTVIKAVRLEDGQTEFDDLTYPFYTKVGRVRVLDQKATVILAGSSIFTNNIDMHYVSIKMAGKDLPKNVGTLTSFSNHMCPAQISWAPRSSNVLYVSSICDKNGLNNHVFKYDIDFEKPFRSTITEVYVVEGSQNFNICAQDRLLNIVDTQKDRNWFYSFDTESSIDAKLYFPVADYGIKYIKNYACDQNNNILQIIGCEAEGSENCYLLTYRANLAHVPNKRVHSVQKIDSKVEFIASSFNDKNDETITLLLGKTIAVKYMYTVEVDGPHLRLKAENENTEGTFVIKENFAFMGENGVVNDDKLKIVPAEHNLTLVRQPVTVSMSLVDPKKKLKADNSLQNLEDAVTISGPFHSLVVDPASKVQINDRMTPTKQFDGLKTVFVDSMFYKDFIFGFTNDGGVTNTLAVYKGDTPKATVPNLDKVSDLQFVAKSDKAFYFFALVKKQYKKDSIYTIYTTNGGDTWTTAHTSLDAEGYQIMEVKNGPEQNFVFGGYNNVRGYQAVAFAFYVNEKSIVGTAPAPYKLNDNIVDFDVTFIEGTRNVIVVAGVEYAKQATFLWYQVDESGYLSLLGVQKEGLVPNEQETHQDIVFRCEQRANSTEFLWCINSGKNLYSYFVKYQLDWTKPTTGLATNFIKKSFVETKLRNIVNLRPIKVDILDDYVAFMVKNDLTVKTGGPAHPGAFFADTYLCLVYKITSNPIVPADGAIVPVRDVFKVLTMSDLEVTNTKALANLDPKFFRDSTDGKARLGINVGADTRSIKVFNTNGLSLIIDQKSNDAKEFKIKVRTIVDGQTSDFKITDFFDFSGDSTTKNKSSLTMIIIICIVVVVIVLGVVAFIVNQKPPQTAEDAGFDDVEKTMKQPDDSSTGQYSKM